MTKTKMIVGLYVGTLIGMAAEVPAWQGVRVGIERMHARFLLRWIEDELCFAVLLKHSVVVIDRHRSVRIVVRCNANTEDQEIDSERQDRGGQRGEECPHEYTAKAIPQVVSRRHEARL